MAVTSMPLGSALLVQVQTGVDGSGNPVVRTRRWSNVKAAATDQDVFDVANVIAGLQAHPVVDIVRQDSEDLEQM
ncbi:MAG: DUF1659 domain-containing protein [Bacillota bacterium]|nr:DUF1659 domain-containing protein [Bacillota bacterium]